MYKGEPYKPDANPFLHAHWTACERAKIDSFRWHDWRHHWATWAARPADHGGAGMDLVTLMKIGGWSSLSQVQRYAAASTDAAYQMLARMR
jgi:integrase